MPATYGTIDSELVKSVPNAFTQIEWRVVYSDDSWVAYDNLPEAKNAFQGSLRGTTLVKIVSRCTILETV